MKAALRRFWHRLAVAMLSGDIETWTGAAPFCRDCPDHEACHLGTPCHVVKKENKCSPPCK